MRSDRSRRGEEVVPAYRALQSKVRALHRLLGKKTLEAEIFQRHGPKGFAMLWPRDCAQGVQWALAVERALSNLTANP